MKSHAFGMAKPLRPGTNRDPSESLRLRFFAGSARAAAALFFITACVEAVAARDWVTKTWTSPNAPAGPLTDLAIGHDGYLLVASGEGVRRFDGMTFSDWPLSAAAESRGWQATAVAVARNGDVWVGFRGEGVVRRRGANRRVYRLRDHETLRFVRSFWEDGAGAIWIASEAGLTIVRGDQCIPQPIPPGQVAYRIKSSPHNGLPWVATDLGLYELQDGKYVAIADRRNLADSRVRDFILDREGGLWIATMGGLVNLRSGLARSFGKTNGLASDWIRRLLLDERGRLWAAGPGGVSWWSGDHFESLGEGDLGKRPDVTAIELGTGGELWITTSSGDLTRLRPPSFSLAENLADLSNSQLLSVAQDSAGHVWFGWNYYGLTESWPGGQHTIRQLGDRPLNRPIALAPARAGGVWCTGTDARLFRAEAGQVYYENIPGWPDGTALSSVLEDRKGRLWVGSFEHGLAGRTDSTWTIFGKSSGLGGSRVLALHEDQDGTIWVAADGLYVLREGRFARFPANAESPFGEITCLQSDSSGNLWVGTHGDGLFRVKGGRWSQYRRAQGLIEDIIHGIVDGEGGHLWLQGPKSVTRLSKSKLNELDQGKRPFHFETPSHNKPLTPFLPPSDGERVSGGRAKGNSAQVHGERPEISPDFWWLSEQGVNTGTGPRQPTCCKLRNGQVLFVTTGGAAVFDSGTPAEPSGKTSVHLEKLLEDGQAIEPGASVQVPAGIRRLSLHWSAVNLSRPESLRFRYRLAGLDSDWLEEGTLREAHYGALPAGQYRFELQVRNVGEAWQDAIQPLNLRQLPRWHERWFIRFACLAALAIGWWTVHCLRIRQIERQLRLVEAERHRIAGELHDTVEQGLAGIAINLDAASRQLTRAPAQAESFLASARRILTRSRDDARQSIWELRSVNRPIGLMCHLEHAVRDLIAGTGMTWEVTAQGSVPELAEDILRRILRLALEAVTNAAKHSKASHLSVALVAASDHLALRIRDNGCGFLPQSTPIANHYGLELMRGRAAQLGGELDITSAPGNGTAVELRIPLPIRPKETERGAKRESHEEL
jgi:signal transduction histidine kinase/ligand-binding sensor domain-containing protein